MIDACVGWINRRVPPFIRFLACGGGGAMMDFTLRWILTFIVPFSFAMIVSSIISGVGVFISYRMFVFEPGNGIAKEIRVFIIVTAFGCLQTLVVSLFLNDRLLPALEVEKHLHEIAHLFGIASKIPTTWVALRILLPKSANHP